MWCLQGKQVLVVDDHDDNLLMLTTFLEFYGALVTTADNGYTALEILQTQQFNLILVDIQMPGMTGLQLLQHLDPATMSMVVAVTARIMPAEVDQMVQVGFKHILPKPLDLANLHATLCSILSQ